MPQFFFKESEMDGGRAVISGDDCHHLLHVRRIRTGDTLILRSDSGRSYMARVSEIGSSSVFADLIAENKTDGELPDITLYMALLKGGNFEFVLQKAVEVGVNRIIPVISSRTVPDPAKKISEKHSRWVRIISGAAKQSMRSGMPEMGYPLSFSDAVKNCSSPVKLIAHPGADTGLRVYLSSMEKPESVSLLVGPEGGFSEQEIELASGSGWEPVNFGSTHLRAETAAVILPSLIIYQWG